MLRSVVRTLSGGSARLFDVFNDCVRHTTLDNGVQVASQYRLKDSKLRFSVLINTGGLDDPKGKQGVAHFLEHVLFTREIDQEMRERGGHMNAFTSLAYTEIHGYLDNTAENRKFILDTLSKMLTADVEPRVFEEQKKRILNEVGYRRDEAHFVHTTMTAEAFSDKQSVCNVLGFQDVVRDISLDDLSNFKRTWFTGPNIFMAFTGVFDHGQLHATLAENLKTIPGHEPPVRSMAEFSPGDYRNNPGFVNQLYFSFNFPTKPVSEQEKAIALLVSHYLNDVIHEKLVEDQCLVYDAQAVQFTDSKRHGFVCIKGNAMPEDGDKITPAVAEVLAKSSFAISPRRLEIIKKRFLDELDFCKHIFLVGHSASDMTTDMAYHGRVLSVIEDEKAIKAITAEQAQSYIREIIFGNEPAIIAYGDHSKLHSYEDFMAMLRREAERMPEASPDAVIT